MSELVITCALLGTAYIISNKNKKEPYEELKPSQHDSILNMKKCEPELTEEDIKPFSHNNMVHFYKNKSNGYDKQFDAILDNHNGTGSQLIDKNERAQLFNPQQNVNSDIYGNSNNNDFYQSRINESNKISNTKPWEEIRVGPDTDLIYNRKILPKTVDELRTTNNPKSQYELNYKTPAYKPTQNSNIDNIGKITKEIDNTHYNNHYESFGPAFSNIKNSTNNENYIIKDSNRDDTSVSYFGPSNYNNSNYINNYKNNSTKKQLDTIPVINKASVGNKNSEHNNIPLPNNNRSLPSNTYFGNIKNELYSNVVTPILSSFNCKKEILSNPYHQNVSNTTKKQTKDLNFELSTTNREMDSENINHLNYQNQTSNGYINYNPYIENTNRNSTSISYIGNAKGVNNNKAKETYSRPGIDKTVENNDPNGNMSLFNSKINMNMNKQESRNKRPSNIFIPNNQDKIVGQSTKVPNDIETNVIDGNILDAFKQNPYTHSLSSI